MAKPGDLVSVHGERALMVYQTPPIAQTLDFHSYIVAWPNATVITQLAYNPDPPEPTPSLIHRITKYVESQNVQKSM